MSDPILENAVAPLARYTLTESVGAARILEIVAGRGQLRVDTPRGPAVVQMADGMAPVAQVGGWYVVHEDGRPSVESADWFDRHCAKPAA